MKRHFVLLFVCVSIVVSAPQLIDTVETNTWTLDVQDDLLFASVTRGNYPNHTPSLQIFGLAEPRSPVEVRRFATPGDARAIAMGDQPSLVAVIADGAGGLTTINSMGCLAVDPDAVQLADD